MAYLSTVNRVRKDSSYRHNFAIIRLANFQSSPLYFSSIYIPSFSYFLSLFLSLSPFETTYTRSSKYFLLLLLSSSSFFFVVFLGCPTYSFLRLPRSPSVGLLGPSALHFVCSNLSFAFHQPRTQGCNNAGVGDKYWLKEGEAGNEGRSRCFGACLDCA